MAAKKAASQEHRDKVSEWWGAVLPRQKHDSVILVSLRVGRTSKEPPREKRNWQNGGGVEREPNLIDEQRCTTIGNFDNKIIIHWRLWVLEKRELDERDHYDNLSRRQKSANTGTS